MDDVVLNKSFYFIFFCGGGFFFYTLNKTIHMNFLNAKFSNPTKAPVLLQAEDPCACKDSWNYWPVTHPDTLENLGQGTEMTFYGCDIRQPDEEQRWCYVNDAASCEESLDGDDWKWCAAPVRGPCSCKSEWSYWPVTHPTTGENLGQGTEMSFYGCDQRQPDEAQPWCYVEDPENCYESDGDDWKWCISDAYY